MSTQYTIPETHLAVIIQPNKTVAVERVPVVHPGPGEVLIKVSTAGQNPADWKVIQFDVSPPGKGVGSDLVGTIVELGAGVEGVALGERVGAVLVARLHESSAFREYVVVPSKPLIRIPDNISDEVAAGVPSGAYSAAYGLHTLLGFPLNAPFNRSILVWGGSASVGWYTIQLAKLTGWKVIATASPHNHELLKSIGADYVFDYRESDVLEKIVLAAGQGGVDYLLDGVSADGSYHLASRALRKDGPRKASVLLPILDHEKLDPTVEYRRLAIFPMLGKEFPYEFMGLKVYHPYSESDLLFGLDISKRIEEWLRDGRITPLPHTVRPGGLNGVQAGLQHMMDGKVSATKLVYKIADTSA
ncbi:hypothetical protein EWM64_g7457 [Hericium alpestre]|uniref:Enoyl reductase (ER) domain-containing protein n=1 Tax=Hericium alpestre TaxID=135208 RepID=A0A4Y9ZNV6_9AGAM|nr:hypothetical protein EWM64_g7457 [Hericium alpestre]